MLNPEAFELEEQPQDYVVSQKDSFCSYSEKLINLYEYYLNLRRSYCDFLEKPDEPTIPEQKFFLSKRPQAKGCKCPSTEKLMILGENYFPRNVTTLTCLKTGSCCNDKRTECQEVKYTIRVLRIRESKEVEHDLHPLLSSNWRSEYFDVVTACVCLMRPTFD